MAGSSSGRSTVPSIASYGRVNECTIRLEANQLTLPPNLIARAKNSTREHTMLLWTLYVSEPQVTVRSENAPVSSRLEAVRFDVEIVRTILLTS